MSEQDKIPLAEVLKLAAEELVKKHGLTKTVSVEKNIAAIRHAFIGMVSQSRGNADKSWQINLKRFPGETRKKISELSEAGVDLSAHEIDIFIHLAVLAKVVGAQVDIKEMNDESRDLLLFLQELNLLNNFPTIVDFLAKLK